MVERARQDKQFSLALQQLTTVLAKHWTHRTATQGTANGTAPGGLVALIREAEALHQALTDAKARTPWLIGALRRERKRSRLVQSTPATLRQLRLQEVVE